MPNIELYGFSPNLSYGFASYTKLTELIEIIKKQIKKIDLHDEVIITIIPSSVKSWHDIDTPFIRICSTNPEEIEKIIDALKEAEIRIDVEGLILNKFVPLTEMAKGKK